MCLQDGNDSFDFVSCHVSVWGNSAVIWLVEVTLGSSQGQY